MKNHIDVFKISPESTLRKAMEYINKGGKGIALVVDKEQKLIGVVTDGDIRRALLSGMSLDSGIQDIIVKNPVTAVLGVTTNQLLEVMMNRGIQQIPILNEEGKVVDIALLRELKRIPLSRPDITQKEVGLIASVLATSKLSIGPMIEEFENKIASYVGTRYAVAVNSGTSALHLCIKSLGIKDGDEIITSPFSFIASANCALFERAKPVFVDINEDTLCIDPERIEEKITPKTKAILPVHIFGYPADMDRIMEIAKQYNLSVIEDAAEALGSEYKGRKVGSFGNMGVFAFYPNKQISTGEGGMAVTDNKEISLLWRSLRNQGRSEGSEWLSHERLGYNYRMSELHAALGVAQMERIEQIILKRQQVAEMYNERLRSLSELKIPYSSHHIKMGWFVYVVRIDSVRFSREDRDAIIRQLDQRGISCRNYFPPIHLEPFYRKMFGYKEGDFPITEWVSGKTIALPFYNNISEEEIDYICDNLEAIIKNF